MDNIEISVFFIGALVVRVIGKWLKRVIKQDRPVPSNSYGMPSGRGVIVGFMATYFFLLFPNMENLTRLVIIISSFFAMWMKYYLLEHTIKQLIAGLVVGIAFGYSAYGVVFLLKK